MPRKKSVRAKKWEPPTVTDLTLTDLPNGTYSAAEVYTGVENWYRYAIGYKDAADRFVGLMSDGYALHSFGPALMFLYRHSIELHLKSLLLDAGELLDDPQTVPPDHYLWTLWIRVRKMILMVVRSPENEWLRRADQIIKQFDQLDPKSLAFRYPTTRDGSPTLNKRLLVDPSIIRKVMGELHILLSGASAQIAEYQDIKQEMLPFHAP